MSYAARKKGRIYTRPSLLGETPPDKTDLPLRSYSLDEDKGLACPYYLNISKKHTQETRKEETKEATRTHDKADEEATNLPDLRPNDRVWIQHHQSKEWYKQATVQESRHNGRAYELIDDEGKTYYRGRRFLRPVHKRKNKNEATVNRCCLLYTSPSPRDQRGSRMPSSA